MFINALQHKQILRPFKRYNLNVQVARRAGELRGKLMHAGVQKAEGPHLIDCLIAATAEYHDLIICTRNSKDFAKYQNYSIASIAFEVY